MTDVLQPADLLTAEPLITAGDRQQIIAGLETAYRVRRADFGPTDAAIVGLANRVALREVTLHYCRYEAPAHIDFPRMEGFRQFFGLTGAGRISLDHRGVETGPQTTGIVPPDSDFRAEYGPGYRHLVLQFDERVLRRKIELLEGRAPSTTLSVPVFQTFEAQKVWRLRQAAFALASQFTAGVTSSRLLASEMAQALVTSFLLENRSAFGAEMAASPTRAGRADIRRLEEYLHAHWDQPLTVAGVAEACGIAVRSLYARFQQEHGVSPLTYMRGIRLDRARAMLSDPGSELSVLDVALRCGFASFGHFARRYRDRFGELPSTTLARRR